MGKRKLSDWNLFVMDVKKNNPSLQFKDVLKLASKLKKTGKPVTNTIKAVTNKVKNTTNKVRKTLKGKKKRRKTRSRTSKK